MKTWGAFLFVALLGLPALLYAADVTSLEFGPDRSDPRANKPQNKLAHERAKKSAAYGTRVAYVKIEGRWVGNVPLPIKTGDLLTSAKILDAMEALEAIITTNAISGYGLRSKGEIGVLYIDVQFDEQPATTNKSAAAPKQIGVIFRPFYVGFSLVQIGDNTLPIPRTPLPTFYENVPKPLLALKPTVTVSHDRAFGTATAGSFDTDLLHLRDPARAGASPDDTRHLDAHGQGVKSFQNDFYRAAAGMRYSLRRTGSALQEAGLRLDYTGEREPLADGQHTGNTVNASGGFKFNLAANTRLSADLGYRRNDDRVDPSIVAARSRTSANEQFGRLLLDTIPRPIYGFLRGAVWNDNGWQTGAGQSYQRLVGRIGYAREIMVAENQAIGIELIAGAGKAWGDLPPSARYFAGNSPNQFLYDSPSSAAMLATPGGPLLRSFGSSEAAFRTAGGRMTGGDAFWHVNVNLTIPIPSWSRPLIPNENTDLPDENGNPTTLKQVLNNQIERTGPSMLAAVLKNEGASDADATEQAKAAFQEIAPATHYMVNDANLFSIKPLLMFDAAGLRDSGNHLSETWLAAGAGVQLTVVIAKFELGYMRTLSGPTFGARGNIFARLVFENLF